jgi:protein TonB
VFSAAGAKGGFGFNGSGGDFGTRFGWYVDAVRRKVSENWMKYEIDPSLSTTRRVYIDFEITRPGSPANIRIEQSSGIPSLDQSALRALQRIDTFGPLPPEYSGSRVSVEFWFDPPVRGR